jgi:outer membrane protein insertion porin family/translocation and assembly module TamA
MGASLAAVVLGGSACASIPAGRSAVDSVHVVGATEVDREDLATKLATEESPKFLGMFRGIVFDYEIFDAAALQRDLARVEHYLRAHGFLEAHVRSSRVVHTSGNHVRVEILVDEGPATHNRRVVVRGLEGLPPEIAAAVQGAADAALPAGARFEEDAYKKAQTDIARALTDRGYAYATEQADAQADLASHAIDYTFTVVPGIPAVFGAITIVGLDPDASGPAKQELGEAPLLRAMNIKPGEPYSTASIDAATQALLDLEVMSAVQIVPQLPDQPGPVVPLLVKIEPAKLREWSLGGGLELDEIKTEIHGLVGWEDHNFLGDLRDFSVDLKPGVVLYPTRIDNLKGPSEWFPEERLRTQLRMPGLIEPRTTVFVRPEVNTYPFLVTPDPKPDQPVVGYFEPKGAIGADRRFGSHFTVTLAHNVQGEIPFFYLVPPVQTAQPAQQPAYMGAQKATGGATGQQYGAGGGGVTTPNFPQQTSQLPPNVLLSFPQLVTTLDFRDDPVHTHKGLWISNDLQVAGGIFQGTAMDVRIAPEVRGYVPITRSVTFAARTQLGFLFGTNYGRYANNQDIQIMYFRGFFSGGPSSNRGFPLRGIAPHQFVSFLNPASVSPTTLGCQKPGSDTNPECLLPVGGFTQWEASAEVRFEISGPFGAAVFCDAGDVSPNEFDIRLSYLHLSCGGGARYDTPVGPIRLDVGYRIQPLQVLGYKSEDDFFTNGPNGTLAGIQPKLFDVVPIAVSFGVLESF